MRVGIDARLAHKEGVGRYIWEISYNAARNAAHDDYLLYMQRGARPTPPQYSLPPNLERRTLRGRPFLVREQFDFARQLRDDRIDVLHATFDFGAPLWPRGKTVLTCHDAFLEPRTWFRSPATKFYSRAMLRHGLRTVQRVVTVSEFVRRKLLTYCADIDGLADRISVVPNGVGEEFRTGGAALPRCSQVVALGLESYLLYVGALTPHKNVLGLLDGYAALRRIRANAPPLVVGGARNRSQRDPALHAERLGIAAHVHFIGFVPQTDLPALYAGAVAFVFPSLHEGFGIPVLEAMACGTPVVTADRAALPEVAGDAALLVDPEDAAALGQALLQICDSATLRASLRERGLARAANYSWARAASRMQEIYREVHAQD